MERFSNALLQLIRTIQALVTELVLRFNPKAEERLSTFDMNGAIENEEIHLMSQLNANALNELMHPIGIHAAVEQNRCRLLKHDGTQRALSDLAFIQISVRQQSKDEHGRDAFIIDCSITRDQGISIRSVDLGEQFEIQEYFPQSNSFAPMWYVRKDQIPTNKKYEGLTRLISAMPASG